MPLLDLPVEIIREILYNLDPKSFYIVLSTAKYFREHALGSCHLLLTQIARVPGSRIFPQWFKSNPNRLLEVFCRRATQHLFHGAERMTDVHVWQSDRDVDRKISGILRWHRPENWVDYYVPMKPYDNEDTLALVEVQPKKGVITLYVIHDGQPQSVHYIRTNNIFAQLSKYKPDPTLALESTPYRVVKVRPVKECGDDQYGWLKLAILYKPVASHDAGWKLIFIATDPDVGPMVKRVFSIESKGRKFIDMAINKQGRPVIVWGNRSKPSAPNDLVISLYGHDQDAYNLGACSVTSLETRISPVEPISRIWVQGECIHLLPQSIPMPRYTVGAFQITPNFDLRPRFTHLPETNVLFTASRLGRTIAKRHNCHVCNLDVNGGAPTCINTALELVITRDVCDNEQVQPGGYLVKALVHEEECIEFNRDEDYGDDLHHIIVAQLASLPNLHQLSTLGLILAVSPQSHRIAIASWKTLLIYSLDPQAFLNPIYSLSKNQVPATEQDRARQAGVPGDYAFIEQCAWQFYENAPLQDERVVLEPVKLECDNVIHQLEWKNEHELWGWGDHGLVRWGIGAESKGERGWVMLKHWVRVDGSGGHKHKHNYSLPRSDFTYLEYLEKRRLGRSREDEDEEMEYTTSSLADDRLSIDTRVSI